MSSKHINNPSNQTNDFLHLYVQNQKRIYGYILSVVSNWSDADDIMQEVTTLMWQKFETFQPKTSFSSWGIQIAKFKIHEFQRMMNKQVKLSEQIVKTLAHNAEMFYTEPNNRLRILERCIKKLNKKDLSLIQMRYTDGTSIKDIALNLERPIQGLYKVMARIHSNLVVCVRRTLKLEGIE